MCMDLQLIITMFMQFLFLSLILATIVKFVAEGMLNAFGITIVWVKRLVVFLMNVLLVYYVMIVLHAYMPIECLVVLLFTCAGAEELHNVINKIKDYKDVRNEISLPETTEYTDSEV